MSFPKGKYVQIDPDNPEPIGVCDLTGFVFMRRDLVRQMEWRGDRLVWTGFYVGRPFVDIPNEQLRSPILSPDPVPVPEPRPQQYYMMTWEQIKDAKWENQSTPWEEWGMAQLGSEALPGNERVAQLQSMSFTGS